MSLSRCLAFFLTALILISCASATVSRQYLVERLTTSNVYVGSRYLYMGSKGGHDYVTHAWERDGFSNAPGSRVFEVRSGELVISKPMAFTVDSSKWQEIDVLEKPAN